MEDKEIITINRMMTRNILEKISEIFSYNQRQRIFFLNILEPPFQFEKGKSFLGETQYLTFSGNCGEPITIEINYEMLKDISFNRETEFFELMDLISAKIMEKIETQRWEYILNSEGIAGSDVISHDKFKEIFLNNVAEVSIATSPLLKNDHSCVLGTSADGFRLRASYNKSEKLFEITTHPVFFRSRMIDDKKIFIK